ncbi:MAG TPA: PQQ-binding-like beta-propeller repeat protein [Polyangiales bacterium]
MNSSKKRARAALAAVGIFACAAVAAAANDDQLWPSAGHDRVNSHNQAQETHINAGNAAKLGVKWMFQTGGDVWATPSVDEDSVYFPDAAGNLYSLNRRTGAQRWSTQISQYTHVPGDISRTTPLIVGNKLIVGDQGGRKFAGATLMAVNKQTGALLWSTKLESQSTAVITQSAIAQGNTIYVGVSSQEELFAAVVPGYKCCSFRGSMLALDANTGAILWKTYMISDAAALAGYSGAAVWGSTPVIDPKRGSVYIATGNNYTVPSAVLSCQTLTTPEAVKACVDAAPGSSDNHFDAIVSLDLRSGAIKWAHSMIPYDAWNVACVFSVQGNEGNCAQPAGPDYDFGQGPTLFSVKIKGKDGRRELLGAGQKSGIYWAVDPEDGSVVWNTQVGPGGSLGGLEWGSAMDGTRIYTAVGNNYGIPWTLPSGAVVNAGFWSALDPATGAILWQTPGTPAVSTSNMGPVTVANGVVFAGTVDAAGTMYALDAASGATLWTFASGGSVNSGAAVVDGVVYWGSGYGVSGIGITPNNKFYAFEVKP